MMPFEPEWKVARDCRDNLYVGNVRKSSSRHFNGLDIGEVEAPAFVFGKVLNKAPRPQSVGLRQIKCPAHRLIARKVMPIKHPEMIP